jgi:hypothetical protein
VTNFYIYPVADQVHTLARGARPEILHSYQVQRQAIYLVQQQAAFIESVSARKLYVLYVFGGFKYCEHISHSVTLEYNSEPTLM